MSDWKPEWMRNVLRIYDFTLRPIVSGAIKPGNDVKPETVAARYVEMELISYCSWDRVRGLFCVERKRIPICSEPPQITHFFFGYRCLECNDVFLIPNTVQDDYALSEFLKHKCEVKGANAQGLQVHQVPDQA